MLPLLIQKLYEDGYVHKENLLKALDKWPMGELSKLIEFKVIDKGIKEEITEALIVINRWFHLLWAEIKQYSVYEQKHIADFLTSLEKKVKEAEYRETLKSDVNEFMDEAFLLIRSVPFTEITRSKYISTPNTAFIMMWMDSTNPGLQDVCNAIKEVCNSFEIQALRTAGLSADASITRSIFSGE